VLSSRERPFLVEPMGTGLRGVTLRFAHEVRSEADYSVTFRDEAACRDDEACTAFIRTKSADFDPSMLENHCRSALVRILRKKQAKRPTHPARR
jgi:non-homologous end joining protein Ku